MNPILYDFKRSFLRVSVLLFLIIFIVGGIGLTYLAYKTLSLSSSALYSFNFVGYATYSNITHSLHVLGLVFDNNGNPLSNVKVYLKLIYPTVSNINIVYYNSVKDPEMYSFTTNASGIFSYNLTSIKIPLTIVLIVNYNKQNETSISLARIAPYSYPSGPIYIFTFENITEFTNTPTSFISPFGLGESFFYGYPIITIFGYNGETAHLIVAGNGTFAVKFYNKVGGKLLGETNVTVNGIGNFIIHIPSGTSYISVITSKVYTQNFRFLPIPEIESELGEAMFSSAGIFLFGFGIIFIYIAYSIFGRLKNAGLIFILSKPITRTQFYLIRYFAGILSILLSSLVFSLAIGISSLILLKLVPSLLIIYFFISIFVGIIVWYTLEFFLSTLLSPIASLGLGIVLYFILNVLFSILVLVFPKDAISLQYYISPTSLQSALTYYATNYNFSGFNVGISILSEILWITIPLLIGIWRFRKMDM
ncbi:hypothetical protein SJAV_03100 [Sulfurisphaera javensis]|uniref:ABC transporter permease n=1 Tax=Sulfurisphaera javensis TaxID=2049879 RepID=A0AAT9GNH8_9CREN